VKLGGNSVYATLQALFSVVHTSLPPLMPKSTAYVVNIPGSPPRAGGREVFMENHDCATMDKQAYLAAELMQDQHGEVIEEGYESLSGELDFVM
jgi:hypothetical protein